VDFAGFVVRADGRIRVRSSSVRRFDRRYKEMLWNLRQRRIKAAGVTQSVRAWVAHASHAQSNGLRRSVLAGRYEDGRPGPTRQFVAWFAWRQLEQQLQQLGLVQPQQQQPDEREQQHRVPRGKLLMGCRTTRQPE
jgi:uncharacterized caspase-like protein